MEKFSVKKPCNSGKKHSELGKEKKMEVCCWIGAHYRMYRIVWKTVLAEIYS